MTRLVITDDNALQFVPDSTGEIRLPGGEIVTTGHIPRDYAAQPAGKLSFASASAIAPIPMEEWPERIADQERNRAGLYHAWEDDLNRKILNQQRTNYCHAFSPAIAMMLARAVAGLTQIELSAGSIGGPVTGYRNRGAWIGDDLAQIVEHGAATTEFVPMLQISRNGWKPGAEENAQLHKVEEWDELGRRDFRQTITALLTSLPVCVGLNWWGHAVTYIRPIDTGRGRATDLDRYDVGALNSWGASYGDGGYFELTGRKRIPDEQYVPRVMRPSVD